MSHGPWFYGWLSAMAALPPRAFLDTFAPTHEAWHAFARASRPVGFLTFHREIIGAFSDSLRRAGWQDLLPPPWDQPPPFAYDSAIDALTDLQQFSQAIEAWHDPIHHQWPEDGFLDARRNIYLRSFWSLHLLIDQRFERCLERNGHTFATMDSGLHRWV